MVDHPSQVPLVEPAKASPPLESIHRQLKDFGPALYAVLAGLLYIFGFLVLNANLSKSGVVDYEFVDARYILSGSVYAYFLVCFYLFAGRTVVHSPRWLSEDLVHYQKLGLDSKWNFIVFLHWLVNAGFSCCMSAGLFGLAAFGDRESAFFYSILVASFLVLYWFDTTNHDIKHPRTHLLVLLAVRTAATVAFFANPESGLLATTFALTLALFFFINLVLDTVARHGATKDRLTYSSVYAVVILLTLAIAFGATLYGSVSNKIGGARPQKVAISLTSEASALIPKELLAGAPAQISGALIHQTDKFVYLLVSEKTIRLRNADVVAIVATPDKQKPFLAEFTQNKFDTPKVASSHNSSVEARPNGKTTSEPLLER